MIDFQDKSLADLALSPFAAWLCIIAALALLRFAPGGVAVLGFTLTGLGGAVVIRDLRFAGIAYGLLGVAVAISASAAIRRNDAMATDTVLAPAGRLLLAILSVIWLKVAADCAFGGLDLYRADALKIALRCVLLPCIVLALRIRTIGPVIAARELAIGFVAFALAYILPLLPFLGARVGEALNGSGRLVLYGQDTINSARMVLYGCLGACVLAADRRTGRYRNVYLMLALAFYCGLLMNQTRQFLIAASIAGLICAISVFRLRVKGVVAFAVGVGFILTALVVSRRTGLENSRFGVSELRDEMALNRGKIWSRAFEATLERPIAGVGFRAFGDEHIAFSHVTQEVIITKDNAHGFVQEVFVEHGMILGFAGVFSVIWAVITCLRTAYGSLYLQDYWLIVALIVGLLVPEIFSGGIANSWSFYLLAIFCMKLRLGDFYFDDQIGYLEEDQNSELFSK